MDSSVSPARGALVRRQSSSRFSPRTATSTLTCGRDALSRYLLDTSAYAAHLGGHAATVKLVAEAREVWLTPVVLGELLAGFRAGGRERQNRARLRDYLMSPAVGVLEMNDETAECYAAIHADLRERGTPVPTNDLWIAATAMQHGLPVLTRDAHFDRVRQVRTVLPE